MWAFINDDITQSVVFPYPNSMHSYQGDVFIGSLVSSNEKSFLIWVCVEGKQITIRNFHFSVFELSETICQFLVVAIDVAGVMPSSQCIDLVSLFAFLFHEFSSGEIQLNGSAAFFIQK